MMLREAVKWYRGGFSSLLHDGLLAADLALDLFAGPAGSLDSAWLELAIGLGLLDQSSQPVLSEGVDELAVRESIGEVTDDTHRGSHESLATVHVQGDDIQQLED
jgi:hypothetical protein